MSARLASVIGLVLALIACEVPAKSRYAMAVDSASRYGFRHVRDRESRLWVHLHCELRVPMARPLPDPISSQETGDLMSTTYFTPETMTTGDFVPTQFRERDGYRVWLARSIARESDFDDSSSYGVQLSFPSEGGRPRPSEPMELFELPAFASLIPYVWSPWRRADEIRGGEMPGWEKLHGETNTPSAAPLQPFEMRCRTVLWDRLFTPVEAEDPNIDRPDPSGDG